jgi:hypothetical protein
MLDYDPTLEAVSDLATDWGAERRSKDDSYRFYNICVHLRSSAANACFRFWFLPIHQMMPAFAKPNIMDMFYRNSNPGYTRQPL